MDTWKEFEHNAISHSAAHHLMAVDTLVRKNGYARVSDVARILNITRGSVSISLKPLKVEGLIEQDENKFIRLGRRGQNLVDILLARRALLTRFLSEILGVDEHQAEVDGCKVEHLISAETAEKLTRLLRFLGEDSSRAKNLASGLLGDHEACDENVSNCPICEDTCLAKLVSSTIGEARTDKLSGDS